MKSIDRILNNLQNEDKKQREVFQKTGGNKRVKSTLSPSVSSKPKEKPISDNLSKIKNQNDNAEIRLKVSGVNPKEDKRNWFEKATNLPQNQNAFFDAMDLLERPLNAINNVAKLNAEHNTKIRQQLKEGKSVSLDKAEGGPSTKEKLNSLLNGLKGTEKSTNKDVLEARGVKNKLVKNIGGFALDVATDPMNFVPLSPVTKGAGKVVKGADKVLSHLKPYENAKDWVGEAFDTSKFKPKKVQELEKKANADLAYQMQKTLNDNTRLVKKNKGIRNGEEVQRNLESELQINKEPKELVNNILNEKLQLNHVDNAIDKVTGKRVPIEKDSNQILRDLKNNNPEVYHIFDNLNQTIKKSDEVLARKNKINTKIDELKNTVRTIGQNHGGIKNVIMKIDDIVYGLDGSPFTIDDVLKNPQKAAGQGLINDADIPIVQSYKKLVKTNKSIKKQQNLVETLAGGLKVKPIEEAGQGLEFVSSRPNLFRKAAGNIDNLLNDISPKKSFDDMISPSLLASVKPIAEQLIQNGKVFLPKNQAPLANELKRLFGEDISTLSKKQITVSLKNTDHLGKSMDDLTFTDPISNVNIKRPERPNSQNVDTTFAVSKIMGRNKELAHLASSYGINISEMSGYMRHELSQTEKAKRAAKVSKSGKSEIGGNNAITKSRTLHGSVEDVNERLGSTHFEENAYLASIQGQKKLTEYIVAEGFKRKVLGDSSIAQKLTESQVKNLGEIPKGKKIIKPDDFNFHKILGSNGNTTLGVAKAPYYMVDKGTYNALKNYSQRLDDEAMHKFFRGVDKVMGMWKKLALFSGGYHMRNALGNMWNMHIAGMNIGEQGKYFFESVKDMKTHEIVKDKLFNGASFDSLSEAEKKSYNQVENFLKEGLKSDSFYEADFRYSTESDKSFEKAVKDASKGIGRKVVDKAINPLESSRQLGESLDTYNRYALYKWGTKKGLNPNESAKQVKEVLFDYGDLTEFERKVMRTAIPFYTFTRKNIPFQLKNFVNNPTKYTNADKAYDYAMNETGTQQEQLPDWLSESMAIPTGIEQNGNPKLLNHMMPFTDLAQWSPKNASNTLVNSLNPLAKTGYALLTNNDSFYNKPIENKADYVLNQLGAVRNARKDISQLMEGNFLDPLTGNMLKTFNSDKEKVNKEYQRKQQLEELMRAYRKKHGERPPTLKELGL
jgi:hypothetical protein